MKYPGRAEPARVLETCLRPQPAWDCLQGGSTTSPRCLPSPSAPPFEHPKSAALRLANDALNRWGVRSTIPKSLAAARIGLRRNPGQWGLPSFVGDTHWLRVVLGMVWRAFHNQDGMGSTRASFPLARPTVQVRCSRSSHSHHVPATSLDRHPCPSMTRIITRTWGFWLSGR